MCAPAMAAMAIASMAMSAYGTYQQGKATQAMANYNAQVADNNAATSELKAQDAIRRGDEEANKIGRDADQLKGTQRATMAARGLDLASGTAAELQDQTDFFSLVDKSTARNNAQKDAWSIRVGGANYTNEAAMQRATAANTNPGFAAATSLVSSGSKVASQWYGARGAGA